MDPQTYPKPKKLPSLDQSHYGVILSGQTGDEEAGICPLKSPFHEAFSVDRNKKSWDACGAVPCTRKVLEHPTVRVEADDNEELTLLADFSFQEAMLLQMECRNEKLCQKLAAFGFKSET